MKCDLCGKSSHSAPLIRHDDSLLCRSCHETVVANIAGTPELIELTENDLIVESHSKEISDDCHLCPACGCLLDELQISCPSCGTMLPASKSAQSQDSINGDRPHLTPLGILWRIILTIAAIVVLVPVALFLTCIVSGVFR